MKVVITGATGNVGTSLIAALVDEPAVTEIVGLARRKPNLRFEKTRFAEADVARDDLRTHFEGAAAVVHLAWLIQPSRDQRLLHAVNVQGSQRVFEATVAAGVPSLVHGSSVGVYSAGPKDRVVDETWSTEGIATSLYSRQKSIVERQLDDLQQENPRLRVVRMRPALIFKKDAASEIYKSFLGRLVPSRLFGRGHIPFVPDIPELRFQAVHSLDVGQAYRTAVVSEATGAFNLAADPVIDADALARVFDARKLKMKGRTLRRIVDLTYALRLQPTNPGWIDMVLQLPIMDVTRARHVLGWSPRMTSTEVLAELLEGIREHAGMPTAPLQPAGPVPS